MDGLLTVEEGTLYDFLEIAARNYGHLQRSAWYVLVNTVARRLKQYNPVGRARRNVAHHYDLSDQLYDLFLDRDRQYSCAYFAAESDSLETAQENKKRHIASKLLLDRQRLRVLDIGSGWGGLGLYLAQEAGADVTGVTLSAEQHKVSQARAADAGLAERVRFHLRDYREESGRYDRIVSVGMFEHVGVPHYREFFRKLKDLLADDGVALLHSIGSMDPPGGTNPWLQKYIFPGGYTPALSEVMEAVQVVGLWVTDIEILRLHYAETLRAWRQRFSGQPRQRAGALRRALLPDVGFLSDGMRAQLPLRRPDGLPDAAGQAAGRRAADARLHGRLGARPPGGRPRAPARGALISRRPPAPARRSRARAGGRRPPHRECSNGTSIVGVTPRPSSRSPSTSTSATGSSSRPPPSSRKARAASSAPALRVPITGP